MKNKKAFAIQTTILLLIFLISIDLRAQNTDQPYQGVIGKTLNDSKEWWSQPVKAPTGAPNVLWVILDDVGFGATSTFGGVIRTPTLDSLANNGLRYTNFHTAAICAPTRAALVTGRLLSRMLYGVSSSDPISVLGAALVLSAVGLLACYLPARWASRVDPLVALREG